MSSDPNVLDQASTLPPLQAIAEGGDSEEAPDFYAEADGWSETEEVFRSSTPVRFPCLGVHPDGRVYALWTSENWIWFTRRVGDGWGEPEEVFGGTQPHMAVDTQGDVHLVFVKAFDRRFQVYYTRYSEPGWMLPYDISRTRGISQHPRVAVAPEEGLVYAVWEDDTPGFPSIYYAYNPEGQWINGPVPGTRGWRPSITFDGEGALHLVWESAIPRGRGDDVFHAQVTPRGWTLAENLSDSPRTDSALPVVAGGPGDTVHVVWEERFGNRSAIGYSAGKYAYWSKPLALTRGGYNHSPTIVVAPRGDVHLIWLERGILGYRTRSAGEEGVWHTPQALDRALEPVEDATIACDAEGNAHVLWTRRVENEWLVLYRRRHAAWPKKSVIPEAVG